MLPPVRLPTLIAHANVAKPPSPRGLSFLATPVWSALESPRPLPSTGDREHLRHHLPPALPPHPLIFIRSVLLDHDHEGDTLVYGTTLAYGESTMHCTLVHTTGGYSSVRDGRFWMFSRGVL